MQKSRSKSILGVLLLTAVMVPFEAQAAFFNRHNVLSDRDLLDADALSRSGIQRFLELKGSGIAHMTFGSLNGVQRRASDIIYDAAQYWGISSKYILVRAQVEQGLVTAANPSQRQLDFATGYGCPDGTGCAETYRGFFQQINWAARAIQGEKYLGGIRERGTTISGWGPGITKQSLDGLTITPENAATAALYTYTPWVGKYGGGDQRFGGTSLVWKTWVDWFLRKYPDGALIQGANGGGIYLIQDGRKRPFWSRSAFYANYDPSLVLIVSPTDLETYEDGSPIKYAPNTLIQAPNGTVFLISRGKKRGILSREVFRQIGFNPEEVIQTSWEDVESIPEGKPITETSIYPTGVLLQSRTSGGVVYVENGIRHAIWSKEILISKFRSRPIIQVDDVDISAYAQGEPIRFRDGEIVTSPGSRSIYIISDGKRRPIDSIATFESLGYRWENVRHTTDKALAIHPLGSRLTLP
ncbi:MAG: hypothetical protein HY341_01810 [Candidatus Kerfeldbacteria bacterium]|nr:hypothetical protein [Candidatus Kerfeldbacteria bacterium]